MTSSRPLGALGPRAHRSPPSKLTITKYLISLALGAAAAACSESDFRGSAETIAPTLTREFTQVTYPAAQTKRTQGYLGEPRTQAFDQGEWGKLDLLVVIDDSGSMAEEQVNLATKLDPLLKYVAKSDWQIAVVTTDPREGCQRALIKKGDANAAQRFKSAVTAGTQGSGIEQGLYQAVAGLKAQCRTGRPWLRADSTVSVLIVSDEDNCYTDDDPTRGGYGCAGQADREAAYLTDYLAYIRTPGQDARVYGLVWHPTTPKSACTTALKQADTYAAIIEQTSGKWGSICEADYTKTLEGVSADIAQILKAEVVLDSAPDADSMSVTVDGKPWPEVTLAGKTVRFTKAPPFGAKVEVAYRVGAAGAVASEFDLDKLPVDGSLTVTLDGAQVDPAAYAWDEAKQRLVFAEAPGEKAELVVDYAERIPLTGAFEIGPTADPRTIKVYVNGEAAADGIAYDAASGFVGVTPPPPAGAAIRVTFRERSRDP
jgi:hypothetical protein